MTERGKALSTLISAGSNTTVKATAGTLYGVHWDKPTNATIRIDKSSDLGASPTLTVTGADTLFLGLAATTDSYIDFTPGVGFDALTLAATSNARVTVVYE